MIELPKEVYKNGLVSYAIKRGGEIYPLVIPLDRDYMKECAIFNPSIINVDDQLYVNLRISNVLLYFTETAEIPYAYGPLQYVHPENDVCLETRNYFCKLNPETFQIERYERIDTSGFDKPPIWGFHGMEDGRLVKWNGELYLTGCRRDDIDDKGTCRMNIQRLEFDGEKVREAKRMRIPTPNNMESYCEKNWAPVSDKPFTYVKWIYPTEVLTYDEGTESSTSYVMPPFIKKPMGPTFFRGSTQVIPYEDKYIAIIHDDYLWRTRENMKNAQYLHRIAVWNKDFNLIDCTGRFRFMNGGIEFTCGMCYYKDDVLITFSYQDNAAFLLKFPKTILMEFIYDQQ